MKRTSPQPTDGGLARRALIVSLVTSGLLIPMIIIGTRVVQAGEWWGAVLIVLPAAVLVALFVSFLASRRRLIAVQNVEDPKGPAERWAAALALADGSDDDELPERKRRERSFRLLMIALAVIAVALAITLIAVGILAPREVDPDGSPLRSLGFILTGVGFLILFISALSSFVGPFKMDRARHPSAPLNLSERLSAIRQIRQQEPVDTEHLPVLISISRTHIRDAGLILPVLTGFLIMITGQIFVNSDLWMLWTGLFVLLILTLGGLGARQLVQARRFIAAHPSAYDSKSLEDD